MDVVSSHGPMDSYLLSNLGLNGLPTIGLSALFASEFLRLYAPAVFQGLSFLLKLFPVPRIWGDAVEVIGFDEDTDLESDPVIIPEEYKKFDDNRTTKKASNNAIERLRKKGYDKYRYNSNHFLKRNGLPPRDKKSKYIGTVGEIWERDREKRLKKKKRDT